MGDGWCGGDLSWFVCVVLQERDLIAPENEVWRVDVIDRYSRIPCCLSALVPENLYLGWKPSQ